MGVRFCPVEAFGAAHRKLHIKSLSAKILDAKSITLLESPPPQKKQNHQKNHQSSVQNLEAFALVDSALCLSWREGV